SYHDWLENKLLNLGLSKDMTSLLRIDKPVGYMLLFWPCVWGVLLASGRTVPILLILLFFIGAIVMRSCGCIINDLFDRKLDAQVRRTKNRPLASSKIKPGDAYRMIAVLLAIGLVVLLLLPKNAQYAAIVGAVLMVIYPLMKRVTYLPQLVLGLAFNIGIVVGYFSLGGFSASVWYLYAAGIGWTLLYDTVYAYQDVDDDRKVGVKSLALLLGQKGKLYLEQLAKFVMILFVLVGLIDGLSTAYYIGLAFAAAHMWWELSKINLDKPEKCMKFFKANSSFGLLVTLALIAEKFW
ncbi:MAG: 4-hydroxybenzoate octaprenyltransferase, partial [Pseudomonadota bacterium]